MGENSAIQWTHHTFNPWIGCEKVSPACDHCYAEAGSKRLGAQRGLRLWQGDRYFTGEDYWKQPARWNRAAEKARERRRVFCASFADVFEDRPDVVEKRADLFDQIALTPWLDWLLLTKRPQNIARMVPWGPRGTHRADPDCWRNVWLGTTCEDQERAEERIPHLLDVAAAVHFVSYEPALGPVDFGEWLGWEIVTMAVYPRAQVLASRPAPRIDWLIIGGESGPRARPFQLQWARDAIRQCREARCAAFVKQLGAAPHGEWGDTNKPICTVQDTTGASWTEESRFKNGRWRLRDGKGGSPSEWPSDLRVREFPMVASC